MTAAARLDLRLNPTDKARINRAKQSQRAALE